MPNVFIVSPGNDMGGVAIGIQRAFEKYGGRWKVRAMKGGTSSIGYPIDLSSKSGRYAELYNWADIIHTMENMNHVLKHSNPPGKPFILHHHGTRYREGHAELDRIANQHRLIQLCSTIDLTIYNKNVRWLPNPIDIDLMQSIRSQYHPVSEKHTAVFSHAPYKPNPLKGTDHFIKAVEEINAEMLLIENQTWVAGLAMKARSDVLLDQMLYGYGLSGLEAMAMGIPVIGGIMPSIRTTYDKFLNELPIMESTVGDLKESLLDILDRTKYYEVSNKGLHYVVKYHSQSSVVDRLKDIYQEALDTYVPEDQWA